jgi:hypothetical protein
MISAIVVDYNGVSVIRGSEFGVSHVNRNILRYTFRGSPLRFLVTSLPRILERNIGLVLCYLTQGRGRITVRAKVNAIAGLGRMLWSPGTVIRMEPCHEFSWFIRTRGEEVAYCVGA